MATNRLYDFYCPSGQGVFHNDKAPNTPEWKKKDEEFKKYKDKEWHLIGNTEFKIGYPVEINFREKINNPK